MAFAFNMVIPRLTSPNLFAVYAANVVTGLKYFNRLRICVVGFEAVLVKQTDVAKVLLNSGRILIRDRDI
jgi:hypothetical protein